MIPRPQAVHVLSAYAESSENFAAVHIKRMLQASRIPGFLYSAEPETADFIAFIEHHPPSDPLFWSVVKNRVYRQYKSKCTLYHDSDYLFPFIPGVYPSLNRKQASRSISTYSSPYIFQIDENKSIADAIERRPSFLYSFVGSISTHPLRKSIVHLKDDPRSLIVDTSSHSSWTLAQNERSDYFKTYANSIINSKFILCPRGISPCSYRLSEAMALGRVPVIISDEWCLPSIIPWDKFALIVASTQINQIPTLLRQNEYRADEMGRDARAVWQKYLSPDKKCKFLLDLLSMASLKSCNAPTPSTYVIRTLLSCLRSRAGLSLARQQLLPGLKTF